MTVRYYARAALLQVRARRAAEEMIDLQPKKDADVWNRWDGVLLEYHMCIYIYTHVYI